MARIAKDVDYAADLLKIRELYVSATPNQRLTIIKQRLEDHHFGANRLVTAVSAVEAMARCLVQRLNARSKSDIPIQYQKFKDWNAKSLVRHYLAARGIDDPPTYLEEDNWKLFNYAVDFRNVLVHECTYLGFDKFPSLIEACDEVLGHLARLGNVRGRDAIKFIEPSSRQA